MSGFTPQYSHSSGGLRLCGVGGCSLCETSASTHPSFSTLVGGSSHSPACREKKESACGVLFIVNSKYYCEKSIFTMQVFAALYMCTIHGDESDKNTNLICAVFFTLVCKRGAPEVMLSNHSGTAGRKLPVAMPV